MAWKEPTVQVLDLSYQWKLTAAIHCGWCWVKQPAAENVLLARATRNHVEHVIDDPDLELVFPFIDDEAARYNFFEGPQLPTPEDVEYVIDDPHHFELALPSIDDEVSRYEFLKEPQFPTPEDFADHIVEVRESKARVFRVIRDPKPIRESDVREEIEGLRPHLSPEDSESDITDAIGPNYSTRSERSGRLGMIEVVYDQSGRCHVDCQDCGTLYAFDRVEAASAAAHVKRYGGICYATPEGLVVYGSKKPYRSLGALAV